MKPDGTVKVYIETPDDTGGFHNATCWLPEYKWEDIKGYSDSKWLISGSCFGNNAHPHHGISQEGGVLNAATLESDRIPIYFWSK